MDEILLFGTTEPDSGVGLSFWKSSGEVERYHRNVFPKLAGSVKHLMNGSPTVRSFNVEAGRDLSHCGGQGRLEK